MKLDTETRNKVLDLASECLSETNPYMCICIKEVIQDVVYKGVRYDDLFTLYIPKFTRECYHAFVEENYPSLVPYLARNSKNAAWINTVQSPKNLMLNSKREFLQSLKIKNNNI